MSEPGKAVFLSYASQDAEAAKRICEALRQAGVEVWFDQSELVGGDQWDGKIRGQISSCALFVPIISAATQARLEGYFRLEWKLAAQRTHTMADEKAFLLPVLIDGTRDAEAKVPVEFKAVQWTKLPVGETPPAFCARVKKLLSGETAGGALGPDSSEPSGRETPPTRGSKRWLAPGIAGGVIALLALVIARPWEKAATPSAESSARSSAPTISESTAPLSEARQLARRAFAPVEHGTPAREQLVTAEALCDRALTLDSTDPEIWTIAARIDVRFIQGNYDTSAARRERAISRAARVIGLAPDLFESRLTQAYVLDSVATTDAMRADAETQLLALLKERPDDPTTLALLANLARKAGRFTASGEYYDRAGSPGGAAWSYYYGEDFVRAGEATERSLRKGSSPAMITLKALLAEVQREDVEAARTIFREVPASAMLEEGPAYNAVKFALHARHPDEVIQILGALPMDYLSISRFSGPKAMLTGRAHEMAGRPEAAHADWQVALGVVGKRLAATPNDPELLLEKTEVLACLGDTPEAEKTLRLASQLAGTAPDEITVRTLPIHVRLGHRDAVLTFLARTLAARENGWRVLHAMARFDSDFDPLRGDPRFEKLLRDRLPEGAKPFADQKTTDHGPQPTSSSLSPSTPPDLPAGALAKVDAKSVAVLAFANLSDDKANEYFSDGISEELLNVLAKVPGLKVTARTSSFHFKGKDTSIPEIASQLGVAYVVEGSVRKQGDRVRITAQLIKADGGFHMWSDNFDRELKDIFAVQDEIAGLIAQRLSLKMGVNAARAPASVTPRAFELYVQARQALSRRDSDGFDRAEQLLTQVLQLEPGLARAHAALADVWTLRANLHEDIGYFGQRDAPIFARIEAEIGRALALDPDSAEAHASLGFARYMEWRFADAERELRQAVTLNPNYPAGHHWLGTCLTATGMMDEGLAEYERAAQLDPFSFRILENYGAVLNSAGRPEQALVVIDRSLALQPKSGQTLQIKLHTLLALERHAEAEAILRELPESDAKFYLVALGRRSEAEAAFAQANDRDRTGFLFSLGRFDEWFERFNPADFYVSGIRGMLFSKGWDPVRRDPRFGKLIAGFGLTEAHARAQAWRAANPPDKPEAKK